jgi:hypothetical protein
MTPRKGMAKTYSEKLRDPRWQKMRLEVMGRDGFACRMCQSNTEMLHVHHTFYRRGASPWGYPEETLLTLCESCHQRLEARRAEIDNIVNGFAFRGHVGDDAIDKLVEVANAMHNSIHGPMP